MYIFLGEILVFFKLYKSCIEDLFINIINVRMYKSF